MESTHVYSRSIQMPDKSFFLFGPRGVGKSFFLNQSSRFSVKIDLLKEETYLDLLRHPSNLEKLLAHLKMGQWVLIDEIQRIPALTNEVHRLIESKKIHFAMTGSSARKLKRNDGNMLGGRALTLNMNPPTSLELGEFFDLKMALQWGSLPLILRDPKLASKTLQTYLQTYLREEIAQEGLIRKLEPFARFLENAGIMNGQTLVYENLSRDSKTSHSTVQSYFQLLEDTLIAHQLPAYRPQAKVREVSKSKFYFFDVGVARAAAGFLFDELDSSYEGFLLETLIFHELRSYNEYNNQFRNISYYGSPSGEIDFIVETKKRTTSIKASIVGIEVKRSLRWQRDFESELRNLKNSGKIKVERMIGVYMGKEKIINEHFEIFPVTDFLAELHSGKIF